MIQDTPRIFIICYKVTPPDYSPKPDVYQTEIPLDQVDAIETGTTLKVNAENSLSPGTNPAGVEIAFQPV